MNPNCSPKWSVLDLTKKKYEKCGLQRENPMKKDEYVRILVEKYRGSLPSVKPKWCASAISGRKDDANLRS